MNRVVLMCMLVVFAVFSGLILSKGDLFGNVPKQNAMTPYYVPQETFTPIQLPAGDESLVPLSSINAIKTIFLEPPTVDEIKKDLGGKSVLIEGSPHEFLGSEIGSVQVLEATPTADDGVLVSVKICADLTVINRKKSTTAHERVAGCLKIHYEKKGTVWNVRTVENTDLQKTTTLNAVAPASLVRVTKYIDY